MGVKYEKLHDYLNQCQKEFDKTQYLFFNKMKINF